jgi:hypothetical protein
MQYYCREKMKKNKQANFRNGCMGNTIKSHYRRKLCIIIIMRIVTVTDVQAFSHKGVQARFT